ncbi:hypothetical protein AGMMS49992_23690 [Clostridia bacterium]|nr:hypothetical protein AGMMS49992_23690 [Clostridia bacterium]
MPRNRERQKENKRIYKQGGNDMRNSEHYRDPTAGLAMRNIERAEISQKRSVNHGAVLVWRSDDN